jgi:hypothetical protein
MAYKIPAMPSQVGVWRNSTGGIGLPSLVIMAQIRLIKDAFFGIGGGSAGAMLLCCETSSDLRPTGSTSFCDFVEAPLHSGKWYYIASVSDVALGFPNTYRAAVIVPQYGRWFVPII